MSRVLLAACLLFVCGCDQSAGRPARNEGPPSRSESKVQPPTPNEAPRAPRQFVSSIPASSNRTIIGNWVDPTPISGSRITIVKQGDAIYADQVFTYDGSGRTLKLRESETPLGIRFDEIEEHVSDSDQPDNGTKATEAGRDFARDKLAELDAFKSSPEFHQYGFGVGGPFNAWLKEVEAQRDDPQFTFYDKLAAGNLLSLGLEYLSSKGKETDLSRLTRREIIEIIESGSINTDAHEYWVIDAKGDLQIRDEDGLISTATKSQ